MDQHQVRPHRCSSRDTSPDRAKICRKVIKPARKVQVVYYLSRNGLLEHPHFMELTLLPNQPLRLKDVFDRLMVLRGSGMPLQYSWSSKRYINLTNTWLMFCFLCNHYVSSTFTLAVYSIRMSQIKITMPISGTIRVVMCGSIWHSRMSYTPQKEENMFSKDLN